MDMKPRSLLYDWKSYAVALVAAIIVAWPDIREGYPFATIAGELFGAGLMALAIVVAVRRYILRQ